MTVVYRFENRYIGDEKTSSEFHNSPSQVIKVGIQIQGTRRKKRERYGKDIAKEKSPVLHNRLKYRWQERGEFTDGEDFELLIRKCVVPLVETAN